MFFYTNFMEIIPGHKLVCMFSSVPMVSAEYVTVVSSFAAATTFSGIRALLHSTQDFSQSKQCQWQGIDTPRTIRK